MELLNIVFFQGAPPDHILSARCGEGSLGDDLVDYDVVVSRAENCKGMSPCIYSWCKGAPQLDAIKTNVRAQYCRPSLIVMNA